MIYLLVNNAIKNTQKVAQRLTYTYSISYQKKHKTLIIKQLKINTLHRSERCNCAN